MIISNDTVRIERGTGLSLPDSIGWPSGKTFKLAAVTFEGTSLCGRYENVSYMGHRSNRTVYYLRADGRFSSYAPPKPARFVRRLEG